MDAPVNLPSPPIVVGADGSDSANRAVAWAAREAVTTGATLRIVNAWSLPTFLWPATMAVAYIDPADLRAGSLALLDRARSVALAAAGSLELDIETIDGHGGPVEQLVAHARGAALLVVGTRGRGGFARLVLGSVASTCAHHSPVPFAVIGADAPPPGMGEIVVGVEDSPGGRAALRWAAGEAVRVGAALRVVHGWEVPVAPEPLALGVDWDADLDGAARDGLARLVEEVLGPLGERPVVEVDAIPGSVPETLVTEAKGAALLVVGSRGRGGFRELLLGSVAQHCLHHAACPLVIVPPPNRMAPIAVPGERPAGASS